VICYNKYLLRKLVTRSSSWLFGSGSWSRFRCRRCEFCFFSSWKKYTRL